MSSPQDGNWSSDDVNLLARKTHVEWIVEIGEVMVEKFHTGGKGNDSWKYLHAVKGQFFRSKCLSYKKNPSKLMQGEEYHVDIQNSSSWESRRGISLWNLQSPLKISSYILWHQSLHMKGHWENVTFSELCSIVWPRLCLADPPCYKILPCQHWHFGGPVQFLSSCHCSG